MGLVSRVGGPECTKVDGATNKLGRRKYGGGGVSARGASWVGQTLGSRMATALAVAKLGHVSLQRQTDRQTDRTQKAHPLY
jgi:hypothetical protein